MRKKIHLLISMAIILCLANTISAQGIKQVAKSFPTPYIPVVVGDNFGFSIEADDSIAVVGAPFYRGNASRSGAAYVFKYDGLKWNKVARLLASDTTVNANLGYSVAVSGDVIVVGARGYNANQGAGYVYVKPSGGWAGDLTQTARLTGDVPNNMSDVFLGFSATVQGDVIALGATFFDNKGAVLVYEKPTSGWVDATQSATLLATPTLSLDQMGYSVSMDNDVIVAGAINRTITGNQIGEAYVFEKPSGGWADSVYQSTILQANNAANGDLFGWDISISGDVVVVGAYGRDIGSNNNQGAAFVFVKPSMGWSSTALLNEDARLANFTAATNDRLGSKVDIQGDVIAVKALAKDTTYLYEKPTSGWSGVLTEDYVLGISNFNSPSFSTQDVVLTDNQTISGFFNQIGSDNEGKIYAYVKPNTGWANANQDNRLRQSDMSNSGDSYGSAVAMQGNVAVVGAYADGQGMPQAGKVYVLKYNGATWQKVATLLPTTPAYSGYFGAEVAIDGDVIAVSAWGMEVFGTSSDKPTIFVYKKPSGGWNGTLTEDARLTPSGFGTTAFGKSLAMDNDVIVVGAEQANTGAVQSGGAYVFVKPSGGWSGDMNETAILKSSSPEAYASCGTSVAIEDDVILVSEPRGNVTGFDEGKVYVYNKPSGGWSGTQTQSATLVASDKDNYDYLGYGLSISDGKVVVGCRYDYAPAQWQGSAYIFEMPSGGWMGTVYSSAKLTASDGKANHRLTNQFVKIDGDRVFLSGVEDTIGGNPNQGSVYMYTKPSGGWSGNLTEDLKLTASDGQKEDYFGAAFDIEDYRMIIGASGDSSSTEAHVGSAYFMKFYDVLSVTSTTANGLYGIGDTIDVVISSLNTLTVVGNPAIELNTGATKQLATYSSGSGSNALTFKYVVKENDQTDDLAYTSEDALIVGGASILDNGRKIFANLPIPGTDSSLSKRKDLVIDGIRPGVTITTLENSPTEKDTVTVTITFSEGVDSFDIDDITTTNAGLINFIKIDDNTYTVDVLPTVGGDFTVFVPFSVGYDTAGNGNKTSNELKMLYNQAGSPTVVITSNEPQRTNKSPFEITITFNEKVSDFDSTDITVTNGVAGNLQSTDSIKYTADITPTIEGMVTAFVDSAAAVDLGMNDNFKSNVLSRYYDPSKPTVTITSAETDPTANSPFSVTITFSEWVSGFALDDIEISNASINNLQTTDSIVFTADVTPASEGMVTIDIKDSVVVDSTANFNTAATQFSIKYGVRPTVIITTTEGDTTTNININVTITFSEEVVGFNYDDIVAQGPVSSLNNIQSTDDIVYTLTIIPSEEGLITLDIPEAVVVDLADNPNDSAEQFKIYYKKTGINNVHLANQTNIYPNPATDDINISAPWTKDKYTVIITDLQGRVVLTYDAIKPDETINITELNKGVYFIRLETETGVVIKKISKL